MINKKVEKILHIFTEDMCHRDEIEPRSEPYLMLYNTDIIFGLPDCPHSHYYYYSYYIYVLMVKEGVLYEI